VALGELVERLHAYASSDSAELAVTLERKQLPRSVWEKEWRAGSIGKVTYLEFLVSCMRHLLVCFVRIDTILITRGSVEYL
jgi:hypothetical protein